MEPSNMADSVDTLFHSLEDFTQREGIIGKAVTQGDKTFLPVVSITVGYAGGNSANNKTMGQGNSASDTKGMGASGLGAKLCTDAVILIDNQNVSMLSTNAPMGNLADKIPQIISGIQNKQQGGAGGSSSGGSSSGSTSGSTSSGS